MPIYEYRCPNDHTFEVFKRMDDPAPGKCEVCGAAPLEQVLYPIAIHYKGSGFYSTDYGKGSKRKPGGDGAGSSESSSSDSGSSDSGGEKKKTDSASSEPKKAAEA